MDDIKKILEYLKEKRGFDFSGYRSSMLERRIQKRVDKTKSDSFVDYQKYLEQKEGELDNLIDVLTINVSRFFRDTFTFEYMADHILPGIISRKMKSGDNSLRVWSAGCSTGEEPYSIAILMNEILNKEGLELLPYILATDIDVRAMACAEEAVYSFRSIKNIKYQFLKKYFAQEGNVFKLKPEIKKMIRFSEYDMLHKKSYVPTESIYGGFDIVLCRNLLIYFQSDFQKTIFNKLYRSLNKNGILFLGEAEMPVGKFKTKFIRETNFCKIYRKI